MALAIFVEEWLQADLCNIWATPLQPGGRLGLPGWGRGNREGIICDFLCPCSPPSSPAAPQSRAEFAPAGIETLTEAHTALAALLAKEAETFSLITS